MKALLLCALSLGTLFIESSAHSYPSKKVMPKFKLPKWVLDKPCRRGMIRKGGVCSRPPITGNTECERQRSKAKINGRMGMTGHSTPTCDADGSFSSLQCNGPVGYCWCALANGETVEGTTFSVRRRGYIIPDCSIHRDSGVCSSESSMPLCVEASKPKHPPIKLQPDCRHCVAEATALRVSPNGHNKVCIPTCQNTKGKEDWFSRVQRCDGKVWCVDKYGHELKGSKKKGDKINCAPFIKVNLPAKSDCEVARAEAKKKNKSYVPSCTKSGKYSHTQCCKQYCWCSMISGKPVPRTFHNKNWTKKPPCKAYYKSRRNCRGTEGLKPYRFDCSRYLSCGPEKAYSCRCPDKQAFDPKLKVCNWIKNVPSCKVRKSFWNRRGGPPKGGRWWGTQGWRSG